MRLRALLLLVLLLGGLAVVGARPAGAIPYNLKPVVTLGNYGSLSADHTRLTLHLAVTCIGPLEDATLSSGATQGPRSAARSLPWTCTGALRHLDVALSAPPDRPWAAGEVDRVVVSVAGRYLGWGTDGRPLGAVQYDNRVVWTSLVAGVGPPTRSYGSRTTSPGPHVLVFRDVAVLRDGGGTAELTYRLNCPVPVAPVAGRTYSHLDVSGSTPVAAGRQTQSDICTGQATTRTVALPARDRSGRPTTWQGDFLDVCVAFDARTGDGPEYEHVTIRNDCVWPVPVVS